MPRTPSRVREESQKITSMAAGKEENYCVENFRLFVQSKCPVRLTGITKIPKRDSV